MPLSFVLAVVILALLVGLRFSRAHGRQFSTAFWIQLLAFTLALCAGLLVGKMSFIVSLAVLLVTLAVTNRAPRLADPQERDALRQRAVVNLEAARRLRRLLEDEIKVHRALREGLLPGVPSAERDQARAMIERRERQTQLELERLEDTIQRLKLGKGAA